MSGTSAPPSGLPRLRLVLAVSLDGRLAPPQGGAAQIGGRGDRRVLEEALAWADGALLGAETLRRHGTTCLIHAPDLLALRAQRGLRPQPVALVASRSGAIPADLPFFAQPLQRWLLLGPAPGRVASGAAIGEIPSASAAGRAGAPARQSRGLGREPLAGGVPLCLHPSVSETAVGVEPVASRQPGFAQVIPMAGWEPALHQLAVTGMERLVVLGGAALAASLLAEDRIEELQLTLCPRLLGGEHSWLGPGAVLPPAARGCWRLLEQRCLEGDELLLRYGRQVIAG